MTEVTANATEGDNDFLSQDEAPLASSTDISAESADDKQQLQPKEEAPQGVLARLFGRRKIEAAIENAAADLLDSTSGDGNQTVDEASTLDESSDGSNVHNSIGEDKSDAANEDLDEEENSVEMEQTNEVGDPAESPEYDSENEEDEIMSLIVGPKTPALAVPGQDRQSRIGSKFTRILSFRGNQHQELQNKESKSLLDANYETDDGEEEYASQQGKSPPGAYHDESSASSCNGDDEDDLGSEEGKYRLESFYPGDTYHDDLYEVSRQNLSGRIQGFGSESVLVYNQGAIDVSSTSRIFTDGTSERRMSSMDLESNREKSGILNGVGRAVTNVTRFILRRPDSDDSERRRMLKYISELERKLDQKEQELNKWKDRSEQLQLEVNRLNFDNNDDGEEEADRDDSSETSNDSGNAGCEEGRALVVFGGHNRNKDGCKEGTLIDMALQKPFFDPLQGESQSTSTTIVTLHSDLMQLVASADTPTRLAKSVDGISALSK